MPAQKKTKEKRPKTTISIIALKKLISFFEALLIIIFVIISYAKLAAFVGVNVPIYKHGMFPTHTAKIIINLKLLLLNSLPNLYHLQTIKIFFSHDHWILVVFAH
jgi:hypothetical protein